MANLPETPQWEDGIYQIEVSDPVLGGPDGISNRQGKQLASRTLYLKQQVEKGGADLAKHIAAADPHAQYAPKASPAFTGTPTAPTPANGDNSKKLATTEFVAKALAALAGSAPETLDTLKELADALGNDPNFATTVLNKLAEKLAKDQNGADIPDPALFVKNLGLGEAAKRDVGTGENQIPDMSAWKRNPSSNRWRKLPDGTIIQMGISASGPLGSPVNITLPISFSNTNYCVVASYDNARSGVSTMVSFAALPVSPSQFSLMSSVTEQGINPFAYWIAFGD
ncbi:gp53-like domain-containing protein [Escherichia coli]|uniref:gp53-like domain-containing protein n=2 Tax=Escherichia coli TaxID=562 RepID=UPI001C0DEBAE|nr:phage tail protein [Escherichia coli]